MERPNTELLINKRKAKWNTLLTAMENKYLSCGNCEGISVFDLDGKKIKTNACPIECMQETNYKHFSNLSLPNTLASKATRNKFKRRYSYQEKVCSNYNSFIHFPLDESNNTVLGNHKLSKNSLNNSKCLGEGSATSENIGIKLGNIGDVQVGIENIQKNKENFSMTRNKSESKPEIDTLCSNISYATKMTDSYENILDVYTNSNVKLIQNIICVIKKQQSKIEKDTLTLNKLVALNLEDKVSPMEKKCIHVYLRQKHIKYNVNKNMMLKLTCLMLSEEYREIYKCIVAMEICRCLNQTDGTRFNSLLSKIREAIYKFLQHNESSILEIYVDYMICTFHCRKKEDMF